MLAFSTIAQPGWSVTEDETVEDCILRIARGDREALAWLYEETHAAVYGFVLSILKNKFDAEDAAHDVYIQIWKKAGSYTARGKPMAWIFTMARNLALMQLREQAHRVELTPEDWQAMFAGAPAVDSSDRLMLEALLAHLSAEERQIVTLHAMTGLKHREIAEILDLRLATVLSKYNRALKKLRGALKEAEQYGNT